MDKKAKVPYGGYGGLMAILRRIFGVHGRRRSLYRVVSDHDLEYEQWILESKDHGSDDSHYESFSDDVDDEEDNAQDNRKTSRSARHGWYSNGLRTSSNLSSTDSSNSNSYSHRRRRGFYCMRLRVVNMARLVAILRKVRVAYRRMMKAAVASKTILSLADFYYDIADHIIIPQYPLVNYNQECSRTSDHHRHEYERQRRLKMSTIVIIRPIKRISSVVDGDPAAPAVIATTTTTRAAGSKDGGASQTYLISPSWRESAGTGTRGVQADSTPLRNLREFGTTESGLEGLQTDGHSKLLSSERRESGPGVPIPVLTRLESKPILRSRESAESGSEVQSDNSKTAISKTKSSSWMNFEFPSFSRMASWTTATKYRQVETQKWTSSFGNKLLTSRCGSTDVVSSSSK